MPISGLVITYTDCNSQSEEALATLRADPRIELGERNGPLQPIVIDTSDRDEDRVLRESLQDLDGILKIDVVFVHVDEADGARLKPTATSVSSSSPKAGGDRQSPRSALEESAC